LLSKKWNFVFLIPNPPAGTDQYQLVKDFSHCEHSTAISIKTKVMRLLRSCLSRKDAHFWTWFLNWHWQERAGVQYPIDSKFNIGYSHRYWISRNWKL